jgi:hypothetical protein
MGYVTATAPPDAVKSQRALINMQESEGYVSIQAGFSVQDSESISPCFHVR